MKIVIFGLTYSSSWGNGHATLWRGLCGALVAMQHRVVFFERREPRDAEEAAAFEQRLSALRLQLEQRRVETELIAEIRAARAQQRELEVRAEEAR